MAEGAKKVWADVQNLRRPVDANASNRSKRLTTHQTRILVYTTANFHGCADGVVVSPYGEEGATVWVEKGKYHMPKDERMMMMMVLKALADELMIKLKQECKDPKRYVCLY